MAFARFPFVRIVPPFTVSWLWLSFTYMALLFSEIMLPSPFTVRLPPVKENTALFVAALVMVFPFSSSLKEPAEILIGSPFQRTLSSMVMVAPLFASVNATGRLVT